MTTVEPSLVSSGLKMVVVGIPVKGRQGGEGVYSNTPPESVLPAVFRSTHSAKLQQKNLFRATAFASAVRARGATCDADSDEVSNGTVHGISPRSMERRLSGSAAFVPYPCARGQRRSNCGAVRGFVPMSAICAALGTK